MQARNVANAVSGIRGNRMNYQLLSMKQSTSAAFQL